MEEYYDVFISYAREDLAWVEKNLYQPLLRTRTKESRRPRIFFDVSEEGIKQGQAWVMALANALLSSKKIITVYSHIYFKKSMTEWELTKVIELDPMGRKKIFSPILIEPGAEKFIPFVATQIQYIDVRVEDWFSRLARSLDLAIVPEVKQGQLRILTEQQNVTVNHTLDPVQVGIFFENAILPGADEIRISAENGELVGTTEQKASAGQAVFSDLAFNSPVASTRLIAKADGHEPGYSRKFAVIVPSALPGIHAVREGTEKKDVIAIQGKLQDLIFFEQNSAFAAVMDHNITTFDSTGRQLSDIPFDGPIRFKRSTARHLVFAGWSGGVLVVTDNGSHKLHLPPKTDTYCIPGDATIREDELLLGYWNGDVYRISLSDGSMNLWMHHPDGVQALQVFRDRTYIGDLAGYLCFHQEDQLIQRFAIEPSILNLRAHESSVVAFCECKVFQFAPDRLTLLSEEIPLSGVSSVFETSQYSLVMDSEGKGLRYDLSLAICSQFQTKPGSVAVSSDKEARYVVFQNPDASRTLMVEGRIVYTNMNGLLSISPDGKWFALGDQTATQILPIAMLPRLYEGS